jgi:hypothetical protein
MRLAVSFWRMERSFFVKSAFTVPHLRGDRMKNSWVIQELNPASPRLKRHEAKAALCAGLIRWPSGMLSRVVWWDGGGST